MLDLVVCGFDAFVNAVIKEKEGKGKGLIDSLCLELASDLDDGCDGASKIDKEPTFMRRLKVSISAFAPFRAFNSCDHHCFYYSLLSNTHDPNPA